MFDLMSFLSYVGIVTFSPGPNNILAMIHANQFGFKRTLKFRLGIFTGFVLLMLISSYGNLFLFHIMPKFKMIMQPIGAIYMFYLAFKIFTSKGIEDSSEDKEVCSFFSGILLQFMNPKVILYTITVVSNFIIPVYQSNIALILFSILLASISLMSTSSWALFGVVFKRFLSRYQKPFNVFMSLILIYSAVSILDVPYLCKVFNIKF